MNRLDERLTLSNPRLIERYMESKLLLRVRFFIRGTDVQLEACFQREPGVSVIQKHVHGVEKVSGFGAKNFVDTLGQQLSEVYASGLRTDREQQTMLLNAVQSIENLT